MVHCDMSMEQASHLLDEFIAYVLVKHLVHTVAEEHFWHCDIKLVHSWHLNEVEFTAYKLLIQVRQVLQLEHVTQFVMFTLHKTHDVGVSRQ